MLDFAVLTELSTLTVHHYNERLEQSKGLPLWRSFPEPLDDDQVESRPRSLPAGIDIFGQWSHTLGAPINQMPGTFPLIDAREKTRGR